MKYLLKRSLRDIRINLSQFISIVLIIAVGSMIFAGLFATTRILKTSLNSYYADYHLADRWVYVEGLSAEEIQLAQSKLTSTQLVGRYRFQSELAIDGKNTTLRFLEKTAINQTKLMSGSEPLADDEILIDRSFATAHQLNPGSSITLKLDDTTFNFRITGTFESPEFAYKSKDFTDAASDKSGFGVIIASHDMLIQLNHHSTVYRDALATATSKFADAQTKLDDAQKTLDENQTKLSANRKSAIATFSTQQNLLNVKKSEFMNGYAQFNAAKSAAYIQLNQLHDQAQSLSQNASLLQTQYDTQYAAYLLVRPSLLPSEQVAQDAAFEALLVQVATLQLQASQLIAQYTLQKAAADQQFLVQIKQLDTAALQLNAGQAKLTASKISMVKQLDNAQKLINDGYRTYDMNRTTFENEKSAALIEIATIPLRYFEVLVAGQGSDPWINQLEKDGKFIQKLDQSEFPGMTMVNNVLAPINALSDIFPLLFFVVAAVIILISMSKNVENDRTQIAVMMALGYPRYRIMFVYLFYGWWAALIGALGFALIGNRVIPAVLISIFTTRFSLPPIALKIYPEYALIALLLALFFASAAILLSLRHVLREIPAAAMRPKPPKNARNSFLERFPRLWNRFNYATKLIVRNLLMGRTKLMLSSIGVVGALTLLIMGLSLRNSATLMINNSISSYHFQYVIHLKEEIENTDHLKLNIEASDIEFGKTISTKLLDTQDTIALNLLVAGEDLFRMKGSSGKDIEIDDDAVVILKSMALLYGLKIGDKLSLMVDTQPIDLTITDINNQYLGKNVYISFDHAARLNLITKSDKVYVANKSGETSQSDIARLLSDPQIRAVDTKENMVNRSKEIMSMLNRIIAIIVLSAAILAMTVLYNLASINIFERQRELATLRVLGYTRREVQRLINVENRVLSMLGIVGGIPLGILLFGWIADMVSTPDFMMSKETDVKIILLAVLMLIVFTEITNLILRRKIKGIKFVESLKGVE